MTVRPDVMVSVSCACHLSWRVWILTAVRSHAFRFVFYHALAALSHVPNVTSATGWARQDLDNVSLPKPRLRGEQATAIWTCANGTHPVCGKGAEQEVDGVVAFRLAGMIPICSARSAAACTPCVARSRQLSTLTSLLGTLRMTRA